MRVLWFSGVEMPAVSGSKLKRGGWIEGYRLALEKYHPQIRLGIAAYSATPFPRFSSGNSEYFSIQRRPVHSKLEEIIRRWQHVSVDDFEVSQYLSIIAEFKPDLIHIHGTENPFGLVLEKIDVPSVLSIQANIARYNEKLFVDYPKSEVVRNLFTKEFLIGQGILHKRMTWNRYLAVERKIMETCQNFIGRTKWDLSVAESFHPDCRYFHCDEVMDDEYYRIEWKKPKNDVFIVYCTSSNAFFKGAIILTKAVSIMKRQGLQINLRMAGVNKNSDIGRIIDRESRADGINSSIEFLGRISPEQIIKEMLAADCFVLPSHIDNSPNSLCEAMLIGMPCIASNVGGIPSLIEDNETGFLFDDINPNMLAEKIIEMKENPARALSLAKNARRAALTRHDRRKVSDDLVRIYDQVMQSN